jgi:hypothetical protein
MPWEARKPRILSLETEDTQDKLTNGSPNSTIVYPIVIII